MTLERINTDKILSTVPGTVCVYCSLAVDTSKEEGKDVQVGIAV